MRVLQLGPYPPPHGGVETNLVAIQRFLDRRGIENAVVNLTRHRGEATPRVLYPKGALELVRLLLRLDHEVVHLHVGGHLSARLLALALVCSLLPGRRTVLTFHSGGYPSSPAGRRARPASLPGLVLRRLDRLVAVNRELVELFARLGCRPERIRLIPPHALTGDLAAQAAEPLREPWATFFARHSPVLVSVGGLEPEYDVPLQVRAMESVLARHPRAGLVVAGRGGLQSRIQEMVDATPYAASVRIAGDVPHPQTLAMIRRADALLRTTHYDGDSISIREALHLGTPVIATDNGLRPEGVHLIRVGDAAGLAAAIERVVAERGPRRPAPAPAGEGNLEAILALYGELCASPGPARTADAAA